MVRRLHVVMQIASPLSFLITTNNYCSLHCLPTIRYTYLKKCVFLSKYLWFFVIFKQSHGGAKSYCRKSGKSSAMSFWKLLNRAPNKKLKRDWAFDLAAMLLEFNAWEFSFCRTITDFLILFMFKFQVYIILRISFTYKMFQIHNIPPSFCL